MPTPSEELRGERSEGRGAAPRRSVFGNYEPGTGAASLAVESGGGAGVCVAAPSNLAPHTSNLARPLQSSIDAAVARTFLYRFLAKAFEDPEPEGWTWLTASEVTSALRSASATLTADPASSLAQLSDQLQREFAPSAYDDFATAYLTCFGHTVRGDCPMNEIEYGDIKADPLFQPHRLADLGAFYAAFGLEVAPDAAQRQDHISIELEFMSVLAAKEAYALEHQFDDDQVALLCDAQKKFLREHLGRWTPAFTRRLARMAEGAPLGALADFTREFLHLDFTRFGVTPGSEDLLLRPIDEASERLCAQCGIQNLPPGAITSPVEG